MAVAPYPIIVTAESDPVVACVMLTRDRARMAARAVSAFRAQTYERKRLMILDTGGPGGSFDGEGIIHAWRSSWEGLSIGHLRNGANYLTATYRTVAAPDIIAHFDDDDISHPNRLAEQVALLQSSGADAVGYSDLVFWDTRRPDQRDDDFYGEAWIYTRGSRFNVPGTSLMYWRKTWERMPFPDLPVPGQPNSCGEDTAWQNGFWGNGMKIAAVSSIGSMPCEPRMIASLHGSNTQSYLGFGTGRQWVRVPEHDYYCRRTMQL